MLLTAVYYDAGKEIYVGEITDVDEIKQLARHLSSYYGCPVGYYVEDNKVVYYNSRKAKKAKEKVQSYLQKLREVVRAV